MEFLRGWELGERLPEKGELCRKETLETLIGIPYVLGHILTYIWGLDSMKSSEDLLLVSYQLSRESWGHIVSDNVGFLTSQNGATLMTTPDMLISH